MKKLAIIIILMTMSIFGFAQDWFGSDVYKADNERIIAAKGYSESYFEVSHKCLEIVLSSQASIAEISIDIAPFL